MSDLRKHPCLRKADTRGHIDEEFTNFGQHYRYAYIPKNEFWIDEEAEHDEIIFLQTTCL